MHNLTYFVVVAIAFWFICLTFISFTCESCCGIYVAICKMCFIAFDITMVILLQTNAAAFLTLVFGASLHTFRFWEFAQGFPWFQFG